MKKIILSMVSIMALSTNSYAGGDRELIDVIPIEIPKTDTNYYIGLGFSSMKLLDINSEENFQATSVMISAGYKIYDFLSIEGRYSRSLKVDYFAPKGSTGDMSDYPSDFTNIGIYLKPSYTYNSISAYALLGYGEVRLTNMPLNDVARAEQSFQWGLGLSYKINDSFSIFADYVNLYQAKGFDYRSVNSDIRVDAITVGITYNF